MTLEEHAGELASDLGVDKAEVKADLENLVSYNVPLDEATRSLRRKYGDGGTGGGDEPASKTLSDVDPGDSAVTVTAVVLTRGTRSIRYQGENQIIHEGELADETGSLSYTAWDDVDFEPGAVVRIANANVREWEGEAELNIGERTVIEEVEADIAVDAPIGGDAELATLEPGDRGVNVEIRVEEVESKLIDGRDGETEILSGVFGDESGRLPFTDWDPHGAIEPAVTLRIENAFVREFRGVPSVNVSEFSTVKQLDRSIEAAASAPRLDIREAIRRGGLFDVELRGNVLSVRDGSGLIERCPECGRVIQNDQCRTHGAVEGEDDLRTKAILDDGTGTVTAILDEDLTAALYGGDIDDASEHARDAMDREVVADAIRETIVGRVVSVRGRLTVDEYGANLEADEFGEVGADPAAEAREFLATVDQ